MRKMTLGLLRDHRFRNLYSSYVVSAGGAHVVQLALPLIALQALDAGAFEVGVVSALSTAAFLLVGLPAGALLDRMRLRPVLVVCDLARAGLLLSLPLAWWSGVLTIWQLYAVVLAVGVCNVFFEIAAQTCLPTLVGRPNLVEANAKIGGVMESSRLVGPAVGGQIIAWLTAPVSVLVTTAALAASSLFVFRIGPTGDPAPREAAGHLRRDIAEGLRYVARHRLLRAMAAGAGWSNLCMAAYFAMMLVFLARDADLSAGAIGVFLSISGVGGLFGAFLARRAMGRLGEGRSLWLFRLIGTPFYLVLPFTGEGWGIWLAAAAMVVPSATTVIVNVAQTSARQLMTENALLGRVNATMRVLNWSTLPLGGLIGGALGGWLGATATLFIAGGAACASFLPIFASPLRGMRHLPRAEEEKEEKSGEDGEAVPAEVG